MKTVHVNGHQALPEPPETEINTGDLKDNK